LLTKINQAFRQRRADINTTAKDLAKHLATSDLQRFADSLADRSFTRDTCDAMFSILRSRFDAQYGGIEKAPKFVMPSIWQFLLRYYHISKQPESWQMVKKTLLEVAKGGLYDQIGGGFARYSVDSRWFTPHFEKMLYDNAQLLSLYAEAYTVEKSEEFANVMLQTIGWLQREMTHPAGGFYSALDADSEGVEGKYYTWTYAELQQVLGTEADALAHYYHCTAEGNWEHGRNILFRGNHPPPANLERATHVLLSARQQRVRPGLDDKILAGWNAMTITALADVYLATSHTPALAMAQHAMQFLEENLTDGQRWYRSFKIRHGATEGFLEDYAYLIQAYLRLYQATFDEAFARGAERWLRYVLENFSDRNEQYFYFTSSKAEALIARRKEIFDNVIPASNSVMARNLHLAGILFDQPEWKKLSAQMTLRLEKTMRNEPGYLSNWAASYTEWLAGLSEVVITGPRAADFRQQLSAHHLPLAVWASGNAATLPLARGKPALNTGTVISVCRQNVCLPPVHTVAEALPLIIKSGSVGS